MIWLGGFVLFCFFPVALSRKEQGAVMKVALGLTEELGQQCVPVNCNIWGHLPLAWDISFVLLCS